MKSERVPIQILSGGDEEQRRQSALSGFEITRSAKAQLAELTGLKPDRVSSLCRDEGGWLVTVDMVELKRIPASTDVIGAYEVQMDDEGNLMTYKRIRRYCRDELMSES